MTTFVSRAETLLNRLGQVKSQQRDMNARSTVERVRTRVTGASEKIAAISAAEPALRNLGVVVDKTPDSVQSAAAKARTVLRSTASSVTGATHTEVSKRVSAESVDEALRSADKIANDLLVKLNRAVNRSREQLQPDDLDEHIVTYPGVDGSLIVRLESVQRRLVAPVEKVNAQDLEQRLQGILRDVETWQRDRPLLNEALERHHPEITEFLRQAATAEGAAWDVITPTVKQWLNDANNTAGLRVVLRS